MTKNQMQKILTKIAAENNTTPEAVRHEMELAIEEGQRCPDPKVQARWNAIPRKGNELTLEEFLDYMINTVNHFYT